MLEEVLEAFRGEAQRWGLRGVLGFAPFRGVYAALMPIQRRRLEELCDDAVGVMRSAISIAYAYPRDVVDAIPMRGYKESWNIYARAYHRLNRALNNTAERIAELVDGIAVPATLEGFTGRVEHVEDFYAATVSHRVAAELAGVGWRGKSGLIVNPRYASAIRLATIYTPLSLPSTGPSEGGCGECQACLKACPLLRAERLGEDYRELCRRYIIALERRGLEADVCGRCVRACVESFESGYMSRHLNPDWIRRPYYIDID
ncbi:epoxyqueuosine reductase [Candidatus Bathyarchaeota archaeon]|nr:epoxyqueuosine reductase [Candidatus Bathyarchaeota archaeon]